MNPPERTDGVSPATAPAASDPSRARPAAADPTAVACPACGHPMHGVRGSRHAICLNCGFKDACCF